MKTLNRLFYITVAAILTVAPVIGYAQDKPATPVRVVAELDIGQTKEITLANGERVILTLVGIDETRDDVRNAIREVKLRVKVDGEEVVLICGNYNLPVHTGKVKIDCTVAKNYLSNSMRDLWKITKDARFRLWPDDSPYIKEGTFSYPIKQRWMANFTHSGNEPSLTGWGVRFDWKKIYYHEGHDIGGADGMDEIVSATDGRVVSIRNQTLEGFEDMPVGGREDRRYERAGAYSEVLKVTDSKGHIDYDFATVYVYDREHPEETNLGSMQLAYHPTLNLKAGDDITFLVRTFYTEPVKTIWDFGDGTAFVETTTRGITKKNHSSGEIEKIKHAYSKSGHYVVTGRCAKDSGLNSVNHLHVVID